MLLWIMYELVPWKRTVTTPPEIETLAPPANLFGNHVPVGSVVIVWPTA